MVNGLPGSMGVEVAAACLRRGYIVADIGLSGSSTGSIDITPEPTTSEESSKNESSSATSATATATTVRLLPVATLSPKEIDDEINVYRDSLPSHSILVAVDYTHPSAVNQNCELYARLTLPFVMGTTGGDRDKLLRDATEGGAFPPCCCCCCCLVLLLFLVVSLCWFAGLLWVRVTHTHMRALFSSSSLLSFFFSPSSLFLLCRRLCCHCCQHVQANCCPPDSPRDYLVRVPGCVQWLLFESRRESSKS